MFIEDTWGFFSPQKFCELTFYIWVLYKLLVQNKEKLLRPLYSELCGSEILNFQVWIMDLQCFLHGAWECGLNDPLFAKIDVLLQGSADSWVSTVKPVCPDTEFCLTCLTS